MKKSLLALSLVAALVSCKKEETPAEFTPTDLTGEGWVKGTTTKPVVTPNGTGGFNTNSRVPAAGVNVTVRIQKSALYPNSNALGADVYTGTTDANGYYNIAVKANGNGVTANVVIDGFQGTLDTVVNGVKKTGPWAMYAGTSGAIAVFAGQSAWFNHNFNASNVGSNPNTLNVGNAIVTGSIHMNQVREAFTTQDGTVQPSSFSSTNVPVPAGTKVYLNFNMDPASLAIKQYTSTTDATGNYTFNLTTVAAGTSGFNQNATLWLPDFATTRDTVQVNTVMTGTVQTSSSTITIPGKSGVYSGVQTTQNGIYNTNIRNAVNFGYNAFTPN